MELARFRPIGPKKLENRDKMVNCSARIAIAATARAGYFRRSLGIVQEITGERHPWAQCLGWNNA